jgi:chemotaxis protein MotA
MLLEFHELNPDLGTAFLTASALIIIFGGTIGCTMINCAMKDVKNIPTLVKIALFGDKMNPKELIAMVGELADISRRLGVLALEDKTEDIRKKSPFFARALQYVIDGQSPEEVESILSEEIGAMEERHKSGAGVFNTMGGFAPTMGIIGTVMGLIGALSKAAESASDPNAIVGAIATAFIATFYGIGAANLLFLPLAGKLTSRSQEEVFYKTVQTEAVLALCRGDSPRMIETTLKTFFRPGEVEDPKKKEKE